MLILTRRVSEAVMIGNDVAIKVLAVKGDKVRIGVNAPKEVTVLREQIHEGIQHAQPRGRGPHI